MPLRDLVQKFSHMRFEPMGRTENREIPVAQSIVDYIFRWLASQFLSEEDKRELGILTPAERARLEAQYAGVQPDLLSALAQPLPAVLPATPSPSPSTERGPGGEVVGARFIAPSDAPSSAIGAPVTGRSGLPLYDASAYRGPRVQADAPTCANCGWIMTRSGTCYRCENCGSTSGCS